jgi:predicted dehydrogenase
VATPGDHGSISLSFADGSLGSLHYFANGHRAFPKERLTVFADGKVLEMDNYRVLRGFGFTRFRRAKSWRQDKGHLAECQQFIERVTSGGPPLIPFERLQNVTLTSLQCEWRGSELARPALSPTT